MMKVVDLTPGVLDAVARDAFRHGSCDALAIAIHRRTGWPLVKISDPWAIHPPFDGHGIGEAGLGGSGIHWAVLTPDGQLLDVDGVHDPIPFVASFDDFADEPTDDDLADGRTPGAKAGYADVGDAVEEHDSKGADVALDVADTFVDVVLAAAGFR